MAVIDLHLVILDDALIVFYLAFVLFCLFHLIVQNLLRHGVARPGGLVTLQIHLVLRQAALILFERPLCL